MARFNATAAAPSQEALQLENSLRTAKQNADAREARKARTTKGPSKGRDALPPAPKVDKVTLTEDVVHGGIELRFPTKDACELEPSYSAICQVLNANMWRFSKFKNNTYDPRWFIKKSDATVEFANNLVANIKVTPVQSATDAQTETETADSEALQTEDRKAPVAPIVPKKTVRFPGL